MGRKAYRPDEHSFNGTALIDNPWVRRRCSSARRKNRLKENIDTSFRFVNCQICGAEFPSSWIQHVICPSCFPKFLSRGQILLPNLNALCHVCHIRPSIHVKQDTPYFKAAGLRDVPWGARGFNYCNHPTCKDIISEASMHVITEARKGSFGRLVPNCPMPNLGRPDINAIKEVYEYRELATLFFGRLLEEYQLIHKIALPDSSSDGVDGLPWRSRKYPFEDVLEGIVGPELRKPWLNKSYEQLSAQGLNHVEIYAHYVDQADSLVDVIWRELADEISAAPMRYWKNSVCGKNYPPIPFVFAPLSPERRRSVALRYRLSQQTINYIYTTGAINLHWHQNPLCKDIIYKDHLTKAIRKSQNNLRKEEYRERKWKDWHEARFEEFLMRILREERAVNNISHGTMGVISSDGYGAY